ncbi:hypothetical protein UY3_04803 [Chelonia mydas]|uniref:Uncharacterized protein n=1 Tax=Chelonia mydas TaxID=8469 RepID=M7BLE2_CHEMY|nr:hypothetical protein UY3_04803 [Chelonia mydas]
MDTSEGRKAAERGRNPEDEVIDEEVELEEDVQFPAGSPDGAGSQELFSTPEVSSQSQQLLSSESEAGDDTPAEHLHQIRKRTRRSKEDMFREALQCSNAEKREQKECWEAEWQDRKENQAFVKDATERMNKVMEEHTEAEVLNNAAD